MEIYQLLLISLITFGAGCLQSTTGFGFGIFSMIFLPYILLYTEANAVASTLSMCTSATVVAATWKKMNWKNIIFPFVGCLAATYFAVYFIKSQDNTALTLLLGIVLLALSVYFFFFSDKLKIKPTWYAGLIAGILSGVLEGMFAIGGPPVVIYFMQSEEDSDHYLATISGYFVLSGIVSVATKAISGFYTASVWFSLLVGVVGMALGSLIGKRARDKANPGLIKKAVYAVMAVSGLVNIVTSIIAMV